jgi:hypothetical protein
MVRNSDAGVSGFVAKRWQASQIVEQAICLRGLDDDVVDVDLDIATDLLLQARLHAPLIGGSHVLQPERHRRVAVYPVRGDEHSFVLIFDL